MLRENDKLRHGAIARMRVDGYGASD